MKTENIRQAFEDYAPVYVLNFGPETKEMQYETVDDWIQRLSHVDGKRVVGELIKHDSISIFDLVNILFPKIVDNESAIAHGINSYQEYLDILENYKRKQDEWKQKERIYD